MGRRAKKAPVQTKKRQTLAKRFKCPFCANENVVECQMNHKKSLGSLSCRMCGANYQMTIHHLHEPVDVFSEWLDDCEAAERNAQAGAGGGFADADDLDEAEDEIPESSGFDRSKGGFEDEGAEASSSRGRTFDDLGLDDDDSD